MSLKHRSLIRNIDEPLMRAPHYSLFKIVSQCLVKINLISKLKLHPSRNLPFSLSTCDNLASISFLFYFTQHIEISFDLFVISSSSLAFDPFNFDIFIDKFVDLPFSSITLYKPSTYEYMNTLLWFRFSVIFVILLTC